MPSSLGCLYLRDNNSPPPQAAWNESVNGILSIFREFQMFRNRWTHVNMEPAAMSLANIGNLNQWIECAEHSCASCGTDKEWDLSHGLSFDNRTLKFAGNHASRFVRMDHDAIVCAQTTNGCARFHRVMALIGCEHHQFTGQTLRSVLFVVREHPMTGRQKRVQIRNRTAWRQNRIAAIPSDDFTHFRQHNRFHQNENWSNFVCEHVRVGRGRQPFASHRNNV